MVKVVFLQNIWTEFFGVMILSSALKKAGHDCEVIMGKDVESLKISKPDLIAFSSMTVQHVWVSEMAKTLKESGVNVPIIVGGPHPTFFPEVIDDPNIDMICRGEGEDAMVELADALENGEDIRTIRNLWVKEKDKIYKNEVRPLIEDLDSVPWGDRELYRKYDYFKNMSYSSFIGSRGCPFDCSFCYNHAMRNLYHHKGKYVRWRSVDNLINEIKALNDKHNIKQVMFVDSIFNMNKKWFISFLEKYKNEVPIPFSCNVRADTLDDETVKKIKETGLCASLRFAIETGNARIRNEVLKKNLTNEEILTATALCKKYDIPVVLFSMFGLPGETLDDAYETVRLTQTIKPLVASNYVFLPYPNLDITNCAISNGYLDPKDIAKLANNPYRIHRSILNQKDINEVTNLHKFAALAVGYPALMPLLRQLIKLPPNKIFDMIYNISLFLEWRKWEKASFMRMLREVLSNYKELA